jgi:sugar lactone lactonase YvrE
MQSGSLRTRERSVAVVGSAAPQWPSVALDALTPVGVDLHRPECVLATASGDLYVSDWRGGVTHLRPDGSQVLYAGPAPGGGVLHPNGIALRADGSFLVAELGPEAGGVFALGRDGQVRPFLERVDGLDLPPTNFAFEDGERRVWITVSTRRVPRALGYRPGEGDGFIVLCDRRGARIVADGLGYTNEVAIHPDGRSLYVNETFARRLSRFALRPDGSLGARQTVAEFGPGTFPDGLCFDVEGGAWITSIVSNRVLRVGPDGRSQVVLEDADPAHLAWVEAAYQAGTMGRPHLDGVRSRRLRNVSSLAFGGPGLRTADLGCLLGDTLMRFDAPVAGHPPPHWHV